MTVTSLTASRSLGAAVLPFALPIGLSAFLLFSVEPLVGRLVLPVFGGTPAVWATTLFFFQAVLLLGYLYGHVSVTRLGRFGPPLHLALAGIAFVALLNAPSALGQLRDEAVTPSINLVGILVAVIGLPAFVITATTPLLSGWFNAVRDEDHGDPYWLYALSNAGSLLALLAYPLLIEPRLGLGSQRGVWAFGYAVLVAMIAWAAWRALPEIIRRPRGYFRETELIGAEARQAQAVAKSDIHWPRRLRWLLLGAVPSGLLSAVTNFIATDLVSAPFLWVIPLAIYLISFIVAFSPRAGRVVSVAAALVPGAVTLLWVPYGSAGGWPILILLVVELLAFAIVAIGLHGRLAQDRPDPAHLTEFYLVISTGGALAAAFVAILAPNVFPDIWELPILLVGALVALALLAPPQTANAVAPGEKRGLDFGPFVAGLPTRLGPYAFAAVILAAGLLALGAHAALPGIRWLLVGALVLAVGGRPWFLALGTALVLVLATLVLKPSAEFRDRSFFGVTEVIRSDDGGLVVLMNGTTVHGMQLTDPADRRTPVSYYDAPGPMGDIFRIGANSAATDPKHVGVVGLGAGGLSAYVDNWMSATFFEIDPIVIEAATDTRYFTYLEDTPGSPRIVLGDARLSLVNEPDATYDLLVMDAFSSDAIPIHLITQEAIRDELRTVAPDGVLAFNISNRYWDLSPAIAAAVQAEGASAFVKYGTGGGAERPYLLPSRWLVATRDLERINAFRASGWQDVIPAVRPFTDDYADLLSYLKLGF